jgi:hypothetical protein
VVDRAAVLPGMREAHVERVVEALAQALSTASAGAAPRDAKVWAAMVRFLLKVAPPTAQHA